MIVTYIINRCDGQGDVREAIDTRNLDNDSGKDWTPEMLENYLRDVEIGNTITEFQII